MRQMIEEEPIESLKLFKIKDIARVTEQDRADYTALVETLQEVAALAEEAEDLTADEAAEETFREVAAEVLQNCFIATAMKNTYVAYSNLQNTIHKMSDMAEADPSSVCGSSLKSLNSEMETVKRTLESNYLDLDHPQRQEAAKVMNVAYETQTKLSRIVNPKAKEDSKLELAAKRSLGGMKISPVSPPTFSGLQKDWVHFWSEFKVVDEAEDLSAPTKLNHLRNAQKDQS